LSKTASQPKVQPEKLPDSSEESENSQVEALLESINREERPGWLSAPTQERYDQDW
jgi:hypothetical protein